jgi:aminopeptidase N
MMVNFNLLVVKKPSTTSHEGVCSKLVALGACDASGAITANADGIGYYRVSYSAPLFAALADRFARLGPADQLTLQSDAWALGEAGLGPVSAYLDLTRKIPVDADVSVWRQTLDMLSYLDGLYQGLPQQAAFRAYAWSLLRPVAARLGWDAKPGEPANDALLRERTLRIPPASPARSA